MGTKIILGTDWCGRKPRPIAYDKQEPWCKEDATNGDENPFNKSEWMPQRDSDKFGSSSKNQEEKTLNLWKSKTTSFSLNQTLYRPITKLK